MDEILDLLIENSDVIIININISEGCEFYEI